MHTILHRPKCYDIHSIKKKKEKEKETMKKKQQQHYRLMTVDEELIGNIRTEDDFIITNCHRGPASQSVSVTPHNGPAFPQSFLISYTLFFVLAFLWISLFLCVRSVYDGSPLFFCPGPCKQ